MTDRRSSQTIKPRKETLLRVEYQHPEELLDAYLPNLGSGGVFVRTSVPFVAGNEISFVISFPGFPRPVELRGIVRWRREEPGHDVGVGVEFVFSDVQQEATVRGLLQSLTSVAQLSAQQEQFKVLLVEDNNFARELFDYAIKRFHSEHELNSVLEVIHATDGAEALEKLEGNCVDLAIVDHFLPVMTGCDLVKRIRQQDPGGELPIIVISVGEENLKRRAIESGANLFLNKPITLKQLIGTIVTLCAQQQPDC